MIEDQPVWDDLGDLVVPAAETASGEIDFADVDLADVHSVTVQAADAGYVGSFDAQITGDGDSTGYGDGWLDWTFTVGNSAIDYLAEGEELEQTYDVTVGDGYAAATQSVTVTITGANDAPVVGEASGAVTEDAAPAIGLVAGDNLLANGGFENGDLSGWSLAGSTDQVGVDNLSFDGGYAGLFGAIGAEAILGQDVQTTAGQQYLLDFRLMGGGDQGADFSVGLERRDAGGARRRFPAGLHRVPVCGQRRRRTVAARIRAARRPGFLAPGRDHATAAAAGRARSAAGEHLGLDRLY